MYWAVTEFDACAGVEVTASHNPIDYNGMKIVDINRAFGSVKDFELSSIFQRLKPGFLQIKKPKF